MGTWSASLQDCLERARRMLRHLENDHLRRRSALRPVGDAEEMTVLAHLEERDHNGGQHAQMPRYFFGVFVRLDGSVWNFHLVAGMLEDQRHVRCGVQPSYDTGREAGHSASDITRMAVV